VSLLDRLTGSRPPERMTTDEYVQMYNQFSFNGLSYGFGPMTSGIQQTLAGKSTMMAPNTYAGMASHAFGANAVVFACMMVRQLVFSSIRFQWRRVRNGKPSDTYGSRDLALLERPWPGGTTQDLLSQMIQHADLSGNAYVAKIDGELVVMRPDWVDVVLEERWTRGGISEVGGGPVGWRKVGYLYWQDGRGAEKNPVGFLAEDVAHFAPIPDPFNPYRGMSWLTPVVREIQSDQDMTKHKAKYFSNGATVNLVIKHNQAANPEAIRKWMDEIDSKHSGVDNAWKNLNLYPGADATAIGSNLKDAEFPDVQAAGEVRIAAAAGVPPIIVGFSKGLDSGTYANYGMARRRFADATAHPLWQNLAGSLEQLFPPLDSSSHLWYDASDVPFLREDEKDAADIQQVRATTIASLIASGFTPESAVAAVEANDFIGLLEHTGLTSVQLQKPGAETPAPQDNQTGGSNDDNVDSDT
jgi:phage portal protein BeeE